MTYLFGLFATILLTFLLGWAFYRWDSREREPFWFLVLAFSIGVCAAIIESLVLRPAVFKFFYGDDFVRFALLVNDQINNPTLLDAVWSAVIVGGVLKEGLKLYAFYQLQRRIGYEMDEPTDFVVYAVMIGLGFQLWENILFLDKDVGIKTFFNLIGLLKHVAAGVLTGFWYNGRFASKVLINALNRPTARFFDTLILCVMLVGVHSVLRAASLWFNWVSYGASFVLTLLVIVLILVLLKDVREKTKASPKPVQRPPR